MRKIVGFGVILSVLVVAVLLSYGVPYSYAKGVSQFTLYGNVIDGSTCKPIQGALVTAPYNSNTTSVTNSTGGYLLRLGYGSWNITISKSGYTPITFNTPYISTGSYQFDTYLIMPGAIASNCTASRAGPNSTVPTTVTAKPTTVVTSSPTTVLQTNQSGGNGTNISNTELIAGIGIVIVIIIIALGYFALRKGSGGKKEGGNEGKKQAAENVKVERKPPQ